MIAKPLLLLKALIGFSHSALTSIRGSGGTRWVSPSGFIHVLSEEQLRPPPEQLIFILTRVYSVSVHQGSIYSAGREDKEEDDEEMNAMDEQHTLLLRAATEGHADQVTRVLDESDVEQLLGATDVEKLTVLHVACEGGNRDIVNHFLALGADTNALSPDGRTVLHSAYLGGNVDVIKRLLDLGLDSAAKDGNGYTSLRFACNGGHIAVVEMLLADGADIQVVDEDNETIFHAACRGSLDVVKRMVELGLDVNTVNKYGKNALHAAVESKNLDITRYLVTEYGLDTNSVAKHGVTVVHSACCGGSVEIVKFLLERGLDVNTADDGDWTGLQGSDELEDDSNVVVDPDVDETKMMSPATSELDETTVDNDIWEAFRRLDMRAVRAGNLHAVKLLLSRGMDANTTEKHHWSALHADALFGNLPIAELLLEHDANAKASDEDGYTVLHAAATSGNVELAKLLLVYGDATVGVVEVPRHLFSVDELRFVVFNAQRYRRIGVRDLTLYLARKGGQWLTGGSDVMEHLRRGVVDPAYQEMDPSWQLDHEELFGTELEPEDEAIHVVVTIPPPKPKLRVEPSLTRRKFLDAVAQQLFDFFVFDVEIPRRPTIGDVLRDIALDSSWAVRTEQPEHMDLRLPDMFTEQEWETLRFLNDTTNQSIHSGSVSKGPERSSYVTLPHRLWDEKRVAMMESIARKSELMTTMALLEAAKDAQLDRVEALLGRDDVERLLNASDEEGLTVLHAACGVQEREHRHLALDGRTVLHSSYDGGNINVVKLLLAWGLEPTAVDKDSYMALHYACKGGNREAVELVLAFDVDVMALDKTSGTTLHAACDGGNLEVVKLLVARGLDVKAVDDMGWSALHFAMSSGKLDVPEYLVTVHGLDVNAVNKDGWSVLHSACTKGELKVVEMLFAHGVDANVASSDGRSVLDAACDGGNLEVAKFLLEHGLDVNAVDTDGWSELHCACMRGKIELVELLFVHGVDTSAVSLDGRSPLHAACDGGHLEVVQFLLKHGLDVHAVNNSGWTALHFAMGSGKIDVPEFLMTTQSLDVNAVNGDGWSVLHCACMKGEVNLVELLLAHDVDMNVVSLDGRSVLHAAGEGGSLDVAKLLVARGLDVKAVDKNG
ncbi:hypothetical protein Poli38472_001808 [Pythium oligandrum]|uniref:Ankyrin repeat protein n=1 Tax=Pythium oligandrum TaxID=41045 RepID=A0A8K1CTI2_PYTOL|nr:hypothetical protein Poli38472_001808 [Pythium oligandrum]|eukprot:TMW69652.1 hypothetical protein Poli38472_001808 [Pythium oligandrum]